VAERTSGLAAQASSSPAQLRALYDDWSPTYDADLASWGYVLPRQVADALTDFDRSGLVLDAGCGTGLVGHALAGHRMSTHQPSRVIGIDLSSSSLVEAASRSVYGDLLQTDLCRRLPFQDESFTSVVSVGVFTYLTNPGPTVSELLRVARPGGSVVFSQRTDLWEQRDCTRLVDDLVAMGACTAMVGAPQPYLPGHPEYADEIGAIITRLTKPARHGLD
jgi:predicted TPR repeat methyltransferase